MKNISARLKGWFFCGSFSTQNNYFESWRYKKKSSRVISLGRFGITQTFNGTYFLFQNHKIGPCFCYWSSDITSYWLAFIRSFFFGWSFGGVDGGTFVLEVDVTDFHNYVDGFKGQNT